MDAASAARAGDPGGVDRAGLQHQKQTGGEPDYEALRRSCSSTETVQPCGRATSVHVARLLSIPAEWGAVCRSITLT